MNTPYQAAVLRRAYSAHDDNGNRLLVALFDGHASDGHQTGFEKRDVSWCVWVRAGQIVTSHRYAGRNRAKAQREFDLLPRELPVTDVPEYQGQTWRQWAQTAKRDTREAAHA